MVKTIMILGAGHFQVPFIQTAKNMGLKVIAIDQNPNAEGSKIADIFKPIDIVDYQEAIKIAKKYDISGVTSVQAEFAVYPVSIIAKTLGLPGISPEVAITATNKGLMRQKWEKNNIPSPNFEIVSTYQELKKAVNNIGLPIVIKPTDNMGSRGVTKVDEIKNLHESYEFAFNNSKEKKVIVEEYMDGSEHSVEAITYKSKTHIFSISDKVRTEPPCMTDISLNYPTSLPIEIKTQIHNLVEQSIETLGFNFGPTHTELMVTDEGPKLIEIAARGAGGDIPTYIIPHVTGIDLGREIINLALGKKPDLVPKLNKGAVLRFIISEPGKIKKIIGINNVKKIPGIERLTLFVKPGEIIKKIKDGTDRLGYFLALDETRENAIALADKAQNIIRIEVE